MRRGQIFILTAVMIAIALAGLVNITFMTSLPAKSQQTQSTNVALINVQQELGYMLKTTDAYYSDYLQFMQNDSLGKNILLTISENAASADGCSIIINGTADATEYNITIITQPVEEKTTATVKVCYS